MTAPTHVAFAELVYLLLLTTAGVAVSAANALVIAVASIAADVDTGSSILGRTLPAVSLRIERAFGHRTLTHSALFVATLAVAALPLLASSKDLYACFVVGYASHPFLDTMNVTGVKLFYPFARVRCVFPFDVNAPDRFRTPTGSRLDRALGALFLAGCIPTFLISQQGHERFIRMTQQTIESAVRDYNELSITHRVVAELSARNLFTKERIIGRYEIAGALDERTLLFRDDQGILRSLGSLYEAEYSTESALCYAVEPVRSVVRFVELENQPLGSLAETLDPAVRTYIFGDLVMRDPVELRSSPPLFSPVSGAGHILRLRFATLRELRDPDLAALLVTRGRLTFRSEILSGIDTARNDRGSDSVGRFAVLSFQCRAGQELEVIATVGDTIRPGQVLARIHADTIRRLQGELESGERAASLDRQRSELASLDARAKALLEKMRADSLEIVQRSQLQEEGFVTAPSLIEAEGSYQQSSERLRATELQRQSLVRRIALRAKADSLKALEGADKSADFLRSEIRGVVHEIRRSVRGRSPEVIFVIKKEIP